MLKCYHNFRSLKTQEGRARMADRGHGGGGGHNKKGGGHGRGGGHSGGGDGHAKKSGGGGNGGIGFGSIALFFLVAFAVKQCGGCASASRDTRITPEDAPGFENASHCTITWETTDGNLSAEFTLSDGRVVTRTFTGAISDEPIPWPCEMRFFHPNGGTVTVQFKK